MTTTHSTSVQKRIDPMNIEIATVTHTHTYANATQIHIEVSASVLPSAYSHCNTGYTRINAG
jgi:hypothetical protein